jgi:PAS domain S-box-containing protein
LSSRWAITDAIHRARMSRAMRSPRLPSPLAYGVAVLSVVGALAARMALDPILTDRQPFPTFMLAVIVAAWFGGFRPALLALGLGWLCADYFFMPPRHAFGVADAAGAVLSLTYVMVGLAVAALSGSMRRAEVTAEQKAQAAEALNQGLARHAEALRDSEARIKGIIASATDAIITIDAGQSITLFNAGAEMIFGYSAAEMLGQPLDRLIPERFREVHRRHIEAFGATGVSMRAMGGERVLAGLRRDGEEFPMEARISQVEVGGQKLYTVILRDITARKRAEAEREELLAEAKRARDDAEGALEVVARMQSITEAAVADLPLDQLLRELVRRVHEALEADTAVILLEEHGVLQARAAIGLEDEVHDRVRVPIGKGFAGRIAKERRPVVLNDVHYDEVVNGYFREKDIRSLVGVPLLSGEGRVLGVLHVGSTRPRQFRDEDVRLLQLAAERVAHGVERAARIEAERRGHAEAEAASRAKDEFLAMLGHELRNPLAAVQNAVVTAKLDASRREPALEIAHRQARQLGRLIDDLLDVARITQGRIMLRKERVHLAEIIQRAVEATRSFVEERRHELSVSLPPDDVRVEADPARVEQIVVNLLTNAAKYTPPGGRIGLTAERQREEAIIRVRDSGMGIVADMLPHVFDLFTQSPRALDRAQGGLGIGLTVVHRLVELHGGRIEAHSEGVGKGAEFVVWLPALPAVPEEAAETRRMEPAHRGRARVLIVEDNADTAESLRMLLELLGHHVRVVHDGGAALDAAQANVPDVMLIDIGLPGMDGYEVARRMRQHPDLKGVILVALTGYGRDEDRQRAFAAGFDYHLVKPVSPDALNGLVARLGKGVPEEPPTVH